MYKHMLLATDLLPENNLLLDKAMQLAKQWGARITLVHIVEPLPGYGYTYVGSADVEEAFIKEAKRQMAVVAKKYDIDSKQTIVDIGLTKTEIIRLAQEHKADVIVLGSHSHSGFGILLGSTANAVLHSATCDVLTIRLKKKH